MATDDQGQPPAGIDARPSGDPVRVSNEYSEVVVREMTGPDWEAVIVQSEPLHYEMLLRPRELRAVVDQDHELFSELLNEPYGPLKD